MTDDDGPVKHCAVQADLNDSWFNLNGGSDRPNVLQLILGRVTWRKHGSAIPIELLFSSGARFDLFGLGADTRIRLDIPSNYVKSFIHNLTADETVVVNFLAGGEQQWVVDLHGTTPAITAIAQCVDITQVVLPSPFRLPRNSSINSQSKPYHYDNVPINLSPIGMNLSYVQEHYPSIECIDDLCNFYHKETPEALCPEMGRCDDLNLFVSKSAVVGYSARFDQDTWINSLELTTSTNGKPVRRTVVIGPMRNDESCWKVLAGGNPATLVYTYTTGTNIQGAPLDVHSIAVFPTKDCRSS